MKSVPGWALAPTRGLEKKAGLSFLEPGVKRPAPSWGKMRNVARDVSALEIQPWLWTPAGGAIVLTMLAGHFIGDGPRPARSLRPELTVRKTHRLVVDDSTRRGPCRRFQSASA